ncbi:MAG: methyltransferase domain-containing protein [Thermodesulfobacteriota bacterium]
MKKILSDILICPACLPREEPLTLRAKVSEGDEILEGSLSCRHCGRAFSISEGIAYLDPEETPGSREEANRYEQEEVVSSYIWSHYGDLLADEEASEAYSQWSARQRPHPGLALDMGAAVGRFTFEMAQRCELAVGLDNSHAFIKTARRLMQEGEITVRLKEEGLLSREITVRLPAGWQRDRLDFIVADAQRVPFASQSFTSCASLNLVDKLPQPLAHLREMNRLVTDAKGQFLFSDPFSWSPEAAEPEEWLGGTKEGPAAGWGLTNISNWLAGGEQGLGPAWQVEETGHVWWKIRSHRNHFELIRSCFIKAAR